MKLSPYGKPQWLFILSVGLMLAVTAGVLHWWIALGAVVVVTLALLAFFRDPERKAPVRRHIMVSPCDGRVSSVHEVEHFEPFNGPAACVRIFMSVLDVHVNRSPCHGMVADVTGQPGKFLNAQKPESAELNAWKRFTLLHPARKTPVAVVRQVAGMIARHIVCAVEEGQILQRGERFGMIKFGSTTELYIPGSASPNVLVHKGQYVWAGESILAEVQPTGDEPAEHDEPAMKAAATK